MRKHSPTTYATTCTQWARVSGGKAWNNPEYATAAHGNVGTSISNVNGAITNGNHPFGPDFLWCPGTDPAYFASIFPTQATWNPSEQDAANKYPNALRFSGFNVSGGGIVGNDVITRILIWVDYRNENTGGGGDPWGMGKFMVTPTKAGGQRLSRCFTTLQGINSVTTSYMNVPCIKDDTKLNDTFGTGNAPSSTNKMWQQGYYYGELDPNGYYLHTQKFMAYNSTDSIAGLTVAELNDPGFYIDLFYVHSGAFYTLSNPLIIYNMHLVVEYIPAYSNTATLTPVAGIIDTSSTGITGLVQNWQLPGAVLVADATPEDAYTDGAGPDINGDYHNGPDPHTASINWYYYTGYMPGGNRRLSESSSTMVAVKLPAIPSINILAEDVSDIVLDFKWNANKNGLQNFAQQDPLRYRVTACLMDGSLTGNGAPIWKHQIQTFPSGDAPTFQIADPGAWPIWGHYKLNWLGEPASYSSEQSAWSTYHLPIRAELGSAYGTKLTNQTVYPGAVYDPLWIEKAIQLGTLYFGLIFRIQPGGDLSYFNTTPTPTAWIKVDYMQVRLNYGLAGAPPPPGATSAGLLIRQTP